uniref:YlxR domain-containing protein n=1 Tax=mine drainage metagenome TaxID=410659 RepID=E6PII2_9ZZZZ
MEPQRQCVGCRKRFEQGVLYRFVRAGAGWKGSAPGERRLPGRGAYLCSEACAQRAERNKRYPGLGQSAREYGLIGGSRLGSIEKG